METVGYTVIPPEREPSQLSAYPTQAHVMFYDGAVWTDVTPSAISTTMPAAIWVNED